MYRQLPSLNLLRSFEVAGRLLSFKQAGEDLHVTPSAISHQVKELEEALGVKLFVRLNRALALTPEGERYLADISAGLKQLSDATDALKTQHASLLNVAAIPFLASDIIAPRLREFQQLVPGIRLKLSGDLRVQDLQEEQIDIGIRFSRNPVVAADFRLLDIACTPICAPRFTQQLRWDPKVLLGKTISQLTGDEGGWRKWRAEQGWQDENTSGAMVFNSYSSVLASVSQGDAVGLGWLPLIIDRLERHEICVPFPDRQTSLGTLYAVVRPASLDRREVRVFLAWLKELLRELDDRCTQYLSREQVLINDTAMSS